MADVPHFSFPFRFVAPQAAVTEQDSIDEIADCVLAVMLCPLGYRVELPEFGMTDLTFATQPVDEDMIRAAVELWEPRAQLLLDQRFDTYDELVAHVEALVQVRTEE